MNVLFILAGDRRRASTRLRVLNYLEVSARDIEATTVTKPDTPDTVTKSRFALETLYKALGTDMIFIQKVPLPEKFLRMLTTLSHNIVFDLDDAVYAIRPWESPGVKPTTDHLDATLSTASIVIAGSDCIGRYAEHYNHHVEVIPTPLRRSRYEEYDVHPPNEKTIGWIGGAENLWYLQNVKEELAEFLDSTEYTLSIMTDLEECERVLDNRDDVEYFAWAEDRELEFLSRTSVGIRPLTSDTWTCSKGGFTSVVQMLAMGIPVVTSPVGMLNNIVKDGENGYLLPDREGWGTGLRERVRKIERRDGMRESSRRSVTEARLWTDQRAPEFFSAIERAGGTDD